MPKISIITPTFNSENTLSGTIEALLRQTFSDFEYIIIDGISTDNTLSVVESYIPDLEKKGVVVHIVSEADKGVYDAMNKGIAKAKGQLVGITNSDDWYEDNSLETMWNKYTEQANNADNVMYYGIERVWKDGKVFNIQRRGTAFISEGTMPHSTLFVPKAIYEKQGMYDLNIKVLADYDFICRCLSQGVELIEVDTIISNFKLGGISSSYFDYYGDQYDIQYKYGFITEKKYKEHKLSLKSKKLINKLIKRW